MKPRSTPANPELPAFVYVLEDPRKPGEIRYIGCTQSPQSRFVQHLNPKVKAEGVVAQWVRDLRSAGIQPRMRILWQGPLLEVFEKEEFAIRRYQDLGFPLLNLRAGHNGTSLIYRPRPGQARAMTGRRQLVEWVRKHGPANKGKGLNAKV